MFEFYGICTSKVGYGKRLHFYTLLVADSFPSDYSILTTSSTHSYIQVRSSESKLSIAPGDFLKVGVDVDCNDDQSQRSNSLGYPSYVLISYERKEGLEDWSTKLAPREICGSGPSVRPLCRSMVRQVCTPESHYRKYCKFRHDYLNHEEEKHHQNLIEESRLKSIKDKTANIDSHDPHLLEDKDSKAASDREFAKFIIDRFGREFLGTGTGIMDVAGGRGHLTFEFHFVHQIPTTLIEPRDVKLRKWQRKKIRRFDSSAQFQHIQRTFDDDLFTSEYKMTLENASILVGMHPDQPTEAIVDYALREARRLLSFRAAYSPSFFLLVG